jgi:hypothetical protein
MSNTEIPTLVKRCLAHGVVISPFQLACILRRYYVFTIPDDVLNVLSKKDLTSYVEGLYYSDQEMAGDWVRGHDILMNLGFIKKEVRQGHRAYVKLVYNIKGDHHGSNC